MRRHDQHSYSVCDASLIIGHAGPYPESWFAIDPHHDHYKLFGRLLWALRRIGFAVGPDPDIVRRHAVLSPNHRMAVKADIVARIDYAPCIWKFEFHRRFGPSDHPSGPRYEFYKVAQMTFLQRMRVAHAILALQRVLNEAGFVDTTSPAHRGRPATILTPRLSAGEWVDRERSHPGRHWRDPKPSETYNTEADDGTTLSSGQLRYFYDHQGRLSRGTIYHNINNMWWVVVNDDRVENIACFRLFNYRPGLALRLPRNPAAAMARDLQRHIAAARFDRASATHAAMVRAGLSPAMKVKVEGRKSA